MTIRLIRVNADNEPCDAQGVGIGAKVVPALPVAWATTFMGEIANLFHKEHHAEDWITSASREYGTTGQRRKVPLFAASTVDLSAAVVEIPGQVIPSQDDQADWYVATGHNAAIQAILNQLKEP